MIVLVGSWLRRIRWGLVAAIVLLILWLVPAGRNAVIKIVSPPMLVLRHAGESIIDSVKTVGSIPTLAKENGQLHARVNELTALTITNQELVHENDLLKKELALSQNSATNNLIAAQVVSRTASVAQAMLLINKGERDGFKKDMAVVAQGFYVGKISELLTDSSVITLVTSPDALLPVVLQQSRSVGLLRGGVEGLRLEEIPRDVAIATGEAVVTAPLGDIVKSGLPIGTVGETLSTKSDVFQSVRINSPIDFSRLEIVFGVK